MVDSNSLRASPSVKRYRYHVFLSFRGEDTRKNFADHLYQYLLDSGLRVFRDNEEIERGEDVKTEIEGAIKDSKIATILFSKDYASSRWCLDELEKIMELRRSEELIVVPVFYGVDPSDVRKQSGSFRDAFTKHEEQYKEDMKRVQRWRTTLEQVSCLAGLVYNDQYESKFIQKIVNEIREKLNPKKRNPKELIVPHKLVGIDPKVEYINSWLQDKSDGVEIASIYGIGGVGKTTMAKIVYNQNLKSFDAGSFLANVREECKQHNLLTLQKQLLSDILDGKAKKIYSANEGLTRIIDALCYRRVIIILDDVDNLNQLDAIIGRPDFLCSGSKILLTTRCEHMPRDHIVCKKLKINELSEDKSIQLFSWHAFGQDHPTESHIDYCKSVVSRCFGLPLALQVLGSTLSGKSIEVWKSAFQKLKAIQCHEIQDTLRISYDTLDDVEDRNLFLHLVCFLLGKKKKSIIRILDGCGYKTILGIENLIDKGLLAFGEYDRLVVHQLLIDMGREIVREESRGDPGKRSRVWHHKEAFDVLKDYSGTETVKGFTLDMHTNLVRSGKRGRFNDSIVNISKRQAVSRMSWVWKNFLRTFSYQSSNGSRLQVRAIAKMTKLQLLQLNHVQLEGNYKDFPKDLRWFCWRGITSESIIPSPSEFHLANLVHLDMRNSGLEYFGKGIWVLPQLKFLNLSYSDHLVRTPIFSRFPSLESLKLKNCISLAVIDETIGDLDRLCVLNLTGCTKLEKLPDKISKLKSLEKLILSDCSSIKELPEHMEEMKSLRVFEMDRTPMSPLLCSSKTMNQLSTTSFTRSLLTMRNRPQCQRFLWNSLPHSLVSLSLKNSNITDIPADLFNFSSLRCMHLGGNPFHTLPENIKNLNVLDELDLSECSKLDLLPALPLSLRHVNLYNCSSLQRSKYVIVSRYLKIFTISLLSWMNREIVNNLGWPLLDSMEGTEVKMISSVTDELGKTSPQLLYECGIYSIFLPSEDVPSWLTNDVNGECSLSFRVPARFCGLNLYIAYTLDEMIFDGNRRLYQPYVIIHNTTKDIRFLYEPYFYGVKSELKASGCILWLSHWKCLDDLLEDGDQVDILIYPNSRFRVLKIHFDPIEGTEGERKVDYSVSPYKTYFSLEDLSICLRPRSHIGFDGSSLEYLPRCSTDYHICNGFRKFAWSNEKPYDLDSRRLVRNSRPYNASDAPDKHNCYAHTVAGIQKYMSFRDL